MLQNITKWLISWFSLAMQAQAHATIGSLCLVKANVNISIKINYGIRHDFVQIVRWWES